MSAANEIATRHNAGLRMLTSVYRRLGAFIDYLPYAMLMDFPRVNADADPPSECPHERNGHE